MPTDLINAVGIGALAFIIGMAAQSLRQEFQKPDPHCRKCGRSFHWYEPEARYDLVSDKVIKTCRHCLYTWDELPHKLEGK